jgi:hypothetical protein
MSMRGRRFGLAGLVLLTSASLLRTSISLASASSAPHSKLNLRLSHGAVATAAGHVTPSSIWAFRALAGQDGAPLTSPPRPITPVRFPDGIRVFALSVEIGQTGPQVVLTNASTTIQLLEALNVRLARADVVLPSRDGALQAGMQVQVVRVRRVVETEVESLEFETLVHYSSDVALGSARVVTPGSTGQAIRAVLVTYRNGLPVDRRMLSYVLLTSPLPRVEIHGAHLAAASSVAHSQRGQASWYECSGMYAAHLSLPFGTVVTVTNLDNGKTVTVVINDRGPYGIADRIIDLCSSAFAQIAPLAQGVARVKISW